MTQTDTGFAHKRKGRPLKGLIGYGLVAVIGIALSCGALIYGKAPLNAGLQLSDWVKWVQIEGTASGLTVFFGILGLIGLTGFIHTLLPARAVAAPAALPVEPVTEAPLIEPAARLQALVTTEVATEDEPPQAPDLPPVPTAEIIPFRQEAMTAQARVETHAETPETTGQPPAADPASADIEAVIHSALRFTEAPDPQPPVAGGHSRHDTVTVRPLSEALMDHIEPDDLPVTPPAAVVSANARALIVAATRTALSQWPETTRPIAEAELGTRLNQLYYDPSPDSREAFEAIGAGDLAAGARLLRTQAEHLAPTLPARAADIWRIYGALHMGREDAQAMHAYEQVSALDASDADIHLYLVHRYEMAGQTGALLPVIARALAVTEDADLQTDLLTRQAELAQSAGDWGTAATALEGLSVLRAREAEADPDNLRKRSAHAITLARLAQVRERLGDYPKAGPLYQHAHEVFAELSAKVPDHAGLKTMAENALRDAQRFTA